VLHVPSDLSRGPSSDIFIGTGLLEEEVIIYPYLTIRCVLIRVFFLFNNVLIRVIEKYY